MKSLMLKETLLVFTRPSAAHFKENHVREIHRVKFPLHTDNFKHLMLKTESTLFLNKTHRQLKLFKMSILDLINHFSFFSLEDINVAL